MDPLPQFPQSDAVVADPCALAREWLPSNDDPARPQITLSTVAPDGFPDSRTVLLSEVTADGFTFHTDARSKKVADIALNPKASILVVWPGSVRQLVIQGLAERADTAEAAMVFALRSPYLKQLAWLNSSEFAVLPLAEREFIWRKVESEHPDGSFEPPNSWIGFEIKPVRFLFWAANPNAASRRAEFVKSEAGWSQTYLPG
jgi:pyridoxamine 5'-phosphate oxidase